MMDTPDILTELKRCLLATKSLEYWREYPHLFEVIPVARGYIDVRVAVTPVAPITVTPRAVSDYVLSEFNEISSTLRLISGTIWSGSPSGGALRFHYTVHEQKQ